MEYDSKKVARQVALSLNNTPMGAGKRKSAHFKEDLWTLKYLPGFKWFHLKQKLSKLMLMGGLMAQGVSLCRVCVCFPLEGLEKRLQAERLKAELEQGRKTADYFAAKADHAKKLANATLPSTSDGKEGAEAAAPRTKTFRQLGRLEKEAEGVSETALKAMLGVGKDKQKRKSVDSNGGSRKRQAV